MTAALLLAFALGACAPAFSAEAPQANRYGATIVPAERFDVGSLLVERHGQRGTPLILVRGLGSGAWAWQDVVRQFSGEHVVYVLTLAGFDSRAPVPGKALDNAGDSLHQLIVSRNLDRPVLIGHSMGAALSIAFAEQYSGLSRGVAAIDGLPVFPGTEVTDIGRVDELAKLSARSDPAAMVDAMAELFALDLRPGLPAIKVPVLLIAPYFEADSAQTGTTREMKTEYNASLMAGAPDLKVASIAPARHFVMFDQPQMLADALRAWLQSL